MFVIAAAAAGAGAIVVVAAAAVVFNDSAANAVIAFVARFAICFVFIHFGFVLFLAFS